MRKLYHTFVKSSIDQEHILIDKVIFNCMLTHFLVLRWSGRNLNIFEYFITVPILIFKDL